MVYSIRTVNRPAAFLEYDAASTPALPPQTYSDYTNKGKRIPDELLPTNWAFNANADMLDIYPITQSVFFVSTAFRSQIEVLAPGCASFHRFTVKVEPKMRPSADYYYMHVQATAQRVRWPEMSTRSEIKENGKILMVPNSAPASGKWVFDKPSMPPSLWREADINIAGTIYSPPPFLVWCSDKFFSAIESKFPNQLRGVRQQA